MQSAKENFLENLKEIHFRSGFKQNFVADKIGVSKQTLCNWFSGRAEPGISMISNLADAYKVNFNDFFKEDRKAA
jgi:transcriptional regulator with XRE-family HTH domain